LSFGNRLIKRAVVSLIYLTLFVSAAKINQPTSPLLLSSPGVAQPFFAKFVRQLLRRTGYNAKQSCNNPVTIIINQFHLLMKNISLILALAVMVWIVQPVHAQTVDTAKNHVEVKKKVKTGVHGRSVTKIKMEGKGTPGTLSGATEGAVTGKAPTPPPPAPAAAPAANPTVVVVEPQTDKKPDQSKPVPVQTTTTHTVSTATSTHVVHHVATVHHKVVKKPVASASTKTTTTTTTVKN